MRMEKKQVDVGAVIDSARYFWVPFGITVMMIIIMLTDGYDLFLMGHVSNFLVSDWGLTRADLGPINTAGMLGMAAGSVTERNSSAIAFALARVAARTAASRSLPIIMLAS